MSDTKNKKEQRSSRVTYILLSIAVILTFIYQYIGQKEASLNHTSSVTMGLLFLAALMGFASFLFSIYDIGAAKKGARRERILLMLAIPCIGVLSLIAGAVMFAPTGNVASDQVAGGDVVASPIAQEPAIVSVLQSVGAKGDYSDLSIRWAHADMEAECGWVDSVGCFIGGTNELILKRGLEPSYEQRAVAHEYLHYVWHKNHLEQDRLLNSYLIDLYGKNPALRKRVSNHYVDSGALNGTELFSYGCTEVSDAGLGAYIVSECNEYIDTSTLAAYY